MFLYLGNRHNLMSQIPVNEISNIVEVGVCKGDNAEWLINRFNPEHIGLVDAWKCFQRKSKPFYFDESNEREDVVENYFGGNIYEQETFDNLYKRVKFRFSDFEEKVKIMKMSSSEASKKYQDKSLDLIYVDADHSYEAVLDDLFYWGSKLRDGGYFVLNDHTINADGTSGYGTVQATNSFIRSHLNLSRNIFYNPIAVTTSNYADLLLIKGELSSDSKIYHNFSTSSHIIEVPNDILSNFHMKTVFQIYIFVSLELKFLTYFQNLLCLKYFVGILMFFPYF